MAEDDSRSALLAIFRPSLGEGVLEATPFYNFKRAYDAGICVECYRCNIIRH